MPRSIPEELDKQFTRDVNSGNLERLLALYEERAVHVRQDGTVARGPDEIRQVMEEFIAMQPRLHLHVTSVVPVDKDIAVVFDRWVLNVAAVDRDSVEMKGTGIHIARRQADAGWLFVATGVGNLIP